MNSSHPSVKASHKELLNQIAEEERLIRIYQAELALQQASPEVPHRAHHYPLDLEENGEEQDWLETLDALQSDGGTTLETKSQDDPKVHRLLPLVGGVTFTSVKALPQQQHDATMRCYELQGNVLYTEISFSVIAKVELLIQKAVVGLDIQFGGSHSCDELEQIKQAAQKMCSIPLLFRMLVSWAEFDAKRTAMFSEFQEKYGADAVERLSADAFRIQIMAGKNGPLCCLQLEWTWRCAWYERGRQQLRVVECNVSPDVGIDESKLVQWLRDICNPQGLNDLVACSGSCEEAIWILVGVLLDSS